MLITVIHFAYTSIQVNVHKSTKNKCRNIIDVIHYSTSFQGIENIICSPRLFARSHAPAAECMSHIPGTWQHQLNIACQPSRARWDQGFFLRTQNPHHVTPPPSSSLRCPLICSCVRVSPGNSSWLPKAAVHLWSQAVCVPLSEDFTSN